MTTPINYDLERHLLNGCTIIKKDSLNFKCSKGDYTHILLECPKDYEPQHDKENRPVKFISLETGLSDGKWFDATYHYASKRDAIKSFYNNLTEDRVYRIKSKATTN